MISRPALASLCIALFAAASAAQTTTAPKAAQKAAPIAAEEPRDIVAQIYKLAAADVTKGKRASPFTDRKVRERYFSKSFDVLISAAETKAAHDGDPVLGFDPISATPDAELKKVVLKTDVLELGKAVVSATFSNHGLPTVVSYDFKKDDGEWKINDIKGTTEKEAWSVRKILTASGKPPTELPGQKTSAPEKK